MEVHEEAERRSKSHKASQSKVKKRISERSLAQTAFVLSFPVHPHRKRTEVSNEFSAVRSF